MITYSHKGSSYIADKRSNGVTPTTRPKGLGQTDSLRIDQDFIAEFFRCKVFFLITSVFRFQPFPYPMFANKAYTAILKNILKIIRA